MGLPNTTIRICDTPFDMGVGCRKLWNSKEEQRQYYASTTVKTYPNGTYQRDKRGFVEVEDLRDNINGIGNILIFNNGDGYENRDYICNIISMEYTNEGNTKINYVVDAYETYFFDVDFSFLSYVSRKTIYNEEKNIIAQLPLENLDIGRFYRANYVKHDTENFAVNTAYDQMYLLITSDAVRGANGTSYGGSTANQLTNIGGFDGKHYNRTVNHPSGVQLFVANGWAMQFVLTQMNTVQNVGALVQVLALPFSSQMLQGGTNIFKAFTGISLSNAIMWNNNTTALTHTAQIDPADEGLSIMERTLNYYANVINNDWTNDYRNNNSEKIPETIPTLAYYMMRKPYSFFQVDDFNGTITDYDYTNFRNGDNADFTGRMRVNKVATLSESPSLVYWVDRYGGYGVADDVFYWTYLREFDTLGKNIYKLESPYNLSFNTDNLNAFLQASQNQRNQQLINLSDSTQLQINHTNASARATANSLKTGYLNTQIQAQNTLQNQQISNIANLTNLGLNTLSSLATGNPLGAVVGSVSGLINIGTSNMITENNVSTGLATASNSLEASLYSLNISTKQSIESALLNQQQAIAMMNAQLQDIENKPNTLRSLGNGTINNEVLFRKGLLYISYVIEAEQVKRIADYLGRYGLPYNYNLSIQDFLDQVKEHKMGFIQCEIAEIQGAIPQEAREELQGVFKNGVVLCSDMEHFLDFEYLRKL